MIVHWTPHSQFFQKLRPSPRRLRLGAPSPAQPCPRGYPPGRCKGALLWKICWGLRPNATVSLWVARPSRRKSVGCVYSTPDPFSLPERCDFTTPIYSHYRSAVISLPRPILTTGALWSHYPDLFSLPERCDLTTPTCSHYRSAVISLPRPVLTTGALWFHYRNFKIFSLPERCDLTTPKPWINPRQRNGNAEPKTVNYIAIKVWKCRAQNRKLYRDKNVEMQSPKP